MYSQSTFACKLLVQYKKDQQELKEFYSTLNDDTDNLTQDIDLTDSDMALLELIKSLSPEMKKQFLKQALQR